MRFFDTFTGYGGFTLGIQRAYENNNRGEGKTQQAQRHGHTPPKRDNELLGQHDIQTPPICIGFSEIDKYATSVYQKHFPTHKPYGDITQINAAELPDFDLLTGGFPCQAFSIAGKRRGFDDTRGTLFFDIARILREKKPRWVVLENVKGLLSHDNGRTFKTIISTLVELGYGVEWQVLNAKNYGVPQNRERVFIVGNLGGECTGQVFPLGEADGTVGEGFNEKDTEVASTLRSRYGNGSGSHIIPTIQATQYKSGDNQTAVAIPVLTPDRPVKRQNGRRFKTDGEPQFTLNTQDKHGIYDGMKIRRLTPTECERLMGLPDGWTARGKKEGKEVEISDSQRYKLCGNGVVVNVVEAVISKILSLP